MENIEIQTEMEQTEEFRDVKFFDHYEVSNIGRVRNKRTGYMLKTSPNSLGYPNVVLSEDGFSKNFKVHRLVADAFLKNIHNKPCIDHIDGNKSNNHVSNLRFSTKSENNMNHSVYKNNTSGYSGVYFDKFTNRWKANIRVDNKKIHLGRFDTKEEAYKVREDAENLYYKEFKYQTKV